MKLNDFKKIEQQINEGFWDSLIGDKNVASIKSIGTGRTTQQQLAMDIFIKDFMGDASTALKTGIKGGLIDPKIKTRPKVNTAGGTGAAQAAQQYNQQRQATRDVNQYIQNLSKSFSSASSMEEKVELTKELINYMADRKGTPEWNNSLGTVKAVLSRHLSKRNLPIALDMIQQGKNFGPAPAQPTTESKYAKLNDLFESILTEAVSVGNYMQNWFAQYMRGVDYSDYNNEVNKLIKQIEQNYPRIKPDLTRLAQMAYSISKGKASGASDAGDGAQAQAPSEPAQPAQPSTNGRTQANQILKDLQQLARTDKRAYDQIIKMMKGV